jgi:hypothetical protein
VSSCWDNCVCERCGQEGHIASACRARVWCPHCQAPHQNCFPTAEDEIPPSVQQEMENDE